MTFLLDTNVFAALSQRKPHRGVERAFTKHAGELLQPSADGHHVCPSDGHVTMPPSRSHVQASASAPKLAAIGRSDPASPTLMGVSSSFPQDALTSATRSRLAQIVIGLHAFWAASFVGAVQGARLPSPKAVELELELSEWLYAYPSVVAPCPQEGPRAADELKRL